MRAAKFFIPRCCDVERKIRSVLITFFDLAARYGVFNEAPDTMMRAEIDASARLSLPPMFWRMSKLPEREAAPCWPSRRRAAGHLGRRRADEVWSAPPLKRAAMRWHIFRRYLRYRTRQGRRELFQFSGASDVAHFLAQPAADMPARCADDFTAGRRLGSCSRRGHAAIFFAVDSAIRRFLQQG